MDPTLIERIDGQIMPHKTLFAYFLAMVATMFVAALGILYGWADELILTVPVIIVLATTIFTDRKMIHIPPTLVFMLILTFYVSIAGKILVSGEIVSLVASILTGINLALFGLIAVYILLKSMPGVRDENQHIVSLFAASASVSIFLFMKMVQHYLSKIGDVFGPVTIDGLMEELICVLIGASIVCIMYESDRTRGLFLYTLNDFLESNSDTFGIEEREKSDIIRLISTGESENLEFKSTLRTNLQTGEVDKRMEKAVLKTLVAFMNSDGGTLLIGIADDGSICGIDMESFDNRDKLNLHLTNLISSMIGNEFLPYISFNLIDFEEENAAVMRVKCESCEKPVFLREGKTEIFYVRSGPSSVELTGMNLINYVNNRSVSKKKRGLLERV